MSRAKSRRRSLRRNNRVLSKTLRNLSEPLESRVLLTAIVSGQTIFASLSAASEQDQYTFAAPAGATFELSLGDANASSAVQPYLTLLGPGGTSITYSRTAATNTSVNIFYTVPASAAGPYTAVVQDYSGTHAGPYALELAMAPSTQAADSDGDGGLILSGQTKFGTINRTGDIDVYTFNAAVGNTFEMSLGDTTAASGVAPYLTIYGPTGALVNYSRTAATNTSVNITYSVPAGLAGTYTAIAQDYSGSGTGAYGLELVVVPALQATDSDGDGGLILSGQTKTGTINRTGDLDAFTFNVAAGNSFEISLGDANSSSAVETDLFVYGPAGALVNYSRTGATNTSVNVAYTVPANSGGTFTAIVQDFAGNATGAYALELVAAPAPQATDSNGDGGVILSGQTKTGNINRTGDLDAYTFTASAGNTFQISLGDASAASPVEPDLFVYGPTGVLLGISRTAATNASVSYTYAVPATSGGTFTALVQDYAGNNTGAYALELVVAPAVQTADSDGDGGLILSGQTKNGTINRTGDLDAYTFNAPSGSVFEVSMGDANATSAVAPDFFVYGPTGAQVTYNRTGNTATSVYSYYTVPAGAGGTFTIIAQDYTGTNTGSYTLELAVAPAVQAADSNGDGGVIVSGQTKIGNINRFGDLDVYTFGESAGNSFDISLGDVSAASAVEPYITVFGPTGALVNSARTGATNTSLGISYTVPAGAGGTYTAVVQDYAGNNTGGYTLELADAPAVQQPDADGDGGVITTGQTLPGTINRLGDLDVFTFSSTASDHFVVTLADATSASAVGPDLFVYGPTGALVNYARTGNTNTSVNVSYTVPAGGSGVYTAIVSDYTGTKTGDYTLNLTGATAPSLGTATVTGRLFIDNNGNNAFNSTDLALSGQQVYLDLGNYGTKLATDPVATTDTNGIYTFTGVTAPANGTVRLVTPFPNTVPVNSDTFIALGGQTTTTDVGLFPTAYTDTAGGDAWTVRANPTNPAQVQVLVNGVTSYSIAATTLAVPATALSFTFTGANDSLTMDFSFGNPFSSAGLNVSEVSTDANTIIGSTGNDIAFINGASIIFDSIPITSTSALPNLSYQPDGGIDSLTLAAQTVQIPTGVAGSGINVNQFSVINLQGATAKLKFTTPAAHSDRTTAVVSGFSITGGGTVDLGGNDMVIHSGTLGVFNSLVKSGYSGATWTGAGINSSAAAVDSTHITGLGVVSNNALAGTPLYTTFDTVSVVASDFLIKYTYMGDANLDGRVDGSDYTRIDNGFNAAGQLSGWANGDFNYDGIINGSDYTQIDNVFNTQGAALTAAPTATVAGKTGAPHSQKSVPPTTQGSSLSTPETAIASSNQTPTSSWTDSTSIASSLFHPNDGEIWLDSLFSNDSIN